MASEEEKWRGRSWEMAVVVVVVGKRGKWVSFVALGE